MGESFDAPGGVGDVIESRGGKSGHRRESVR
jgi:hypothetical protein